MKFLALILLLAASAAAAPGPITAIGLQDGKPIEVPLPPDLGTNPARLEESLHAAVAQGGSVLVPNCLIVLSHPIVLSQPCTWIHGLGPMSRLTMGPNAAKDVDRIIYPQAPDCRVSDLRFGGGPKKVVGVFLDGRSRVADRLTIERCQFDGCGYAMVLTGGPVTQETDILEDFSFLDNRIIHPVHGGVQMSWEMLRTKIQRNVLIGDGAASDWNALQMCLGVVDAVITDNVFGKIGRMGIEIFYAKCASGGGGGQGSALVNKLHPNGPSVTASNNIIFDTGSFGESWAGCKRSRLSGDTIRNATSIGAEFVDEDTTSPSQYSVENYSITNTAGYAVSIDKLKSGSFRNFLVDGVTAQAGYQFGVQVYQSDDISLDGWTLTGAGPRYVLHNSSTRTSITNCRFTAKMGESFPGQEGGNFALYVYGGDCYFHGNIIRGNPTNPLRCCVNNATVTTSPSAEPLTMYDPNFDDPDNYRGHRYVKE